MFEGLVVYVQSNFRDVGFAGLLFVDPKHPLYIMPSKLYFPTDEKLKEEKARLSGSQFRKKYDGLGPGLGELIDFTAEGRVVTYFELSMKKVYGGVLPEWGVWIGRGFEQGVICDIGIIPPDQVDRRVGTHSQIWTRRLGFVSAANHQLRNLVSNIPYQCLIEYDLDFCGKDPADYPYDVTDEKISELDPVIRFRLNRMVRSNPNHWRYVPQAPFNRNMLQGVLPGMDDFFEEQLPPPSTNPDIPPWSFCASFCLPISREFIFCPRFPNTKIHLSVLNPNDYWFKPGVVVRVYVTKCEFTHRLIALTCRKEPINWEWDCAGNPRFITRKDQGILLFRMLVRCTRLKGYFYNPIVSFVRDEYGLLDDLLDRHKDRDQFWVWARFDGGAPGATKFFVKSVCSTEM